MKEPQLHSGILVSNSVRKGYDQSKSHKLLNFIFKETRFFFSKYIIVYSHAGFLLSNNDYVIALDYINLAKLCETCT